MTENRLRQPEDVFQPCLTCNRKFFKSDAHWCCEKCRQYDERAACLEDCEACIAMVEEEWRRKAWEINSLKKKSYLKSKGKFGISSRKSSPRKKVIKGASEKKENLPKGNKLKGEKSKVSKGPKLKGGEKNKGSKQKTVDTVYANRLLDFEALLYGDLNPSIPSSLTEKGFKLAGVPKNLKNMYDVTKCELVRLLASASICYHLSKNRSQFCDENQIFDANSDGIVSLFAALIKFKANCFGKVVFDIREALLSGATCADPDIITKMIKGPINPKESFFGNIDALKEAVKQDRRNVLKMKGSKSSKDPSSSDEPDAEHSDSNGSQI